MIKLANKNKCTGCMACYDACPSSAITCNIGSDGHYYPNIHRDKCIECGLCVKSCPLNNTQSSQRNIKPLALAAWSDKYNYINKSTSGGVFPTLARYIIDNGGYVIGVSMEHSMAKHIVISSIDDIPLLQGSKYQQSNTQGIYKRCKALLKKGSMVLFTGTPCQVAGLYSYLNCTYPNLITIDVICAGVPSKLVVDKYRDMMPNSDIVSYRDKTHGWGGLNMTTIEDGKLVRCSKDGDILGKAVAGHQTDRYSCYDCQFVGINRYADITIGDFWGGEKYFPEQAKKGLSVIITHTEKGLKIVNQSGITAHKVPLVTAIKKNPRIVFGKNLVGRWRLERKFITPLINRLPYSVYASLYAGVHTSKLHLPIKVYRWALWKLETSWTKRQLSKVINMYDEN